MRSGGSGNYVPHKKPRHCPEGHWRCSMCNRLVKIDDERLAGLLLCERCTEAIRPSEVVIEVMKFPKSDYGRTPRPENDPSRWPELAHKGPKARNARKSRAVIRNEDGRRFRNVQEAAKVASGGTKGPSSLYAHLQGKNKTFCGCTFRYEDEGKK